MRNRFGVPTQIVWVIMLFGFVFVAVLSVVGNEVAVRIENYINIVLSFACVARYRHEAIRALITKLPTSIQILCLGIFFNWIANNIRSFLSTLARDFDILWLNDSVIVPIFLFFTFMSGVFHLIVPYVEPTKIDRKAWYEVLAIVVGGTSLALIVTLDLYLFPHAIVSSL